MQKRLIGATLGVAALFATLTAHAQSNVTLYGLIDGGLTYANHVSTAAGTGSVLKYADGVAQGSRFGLRGTEDLGDGLKAIFTLEAGFSSADGTSAQGGALFGRQAFVGLSQSGVGSLTFGRQYSLSRDVLHNYAMGHETPAGNYAYHINDLDQLTSSRINHAIKFSSADFGGLTFGALYGFSNEAGSYAGSPTVTSNGTMRQGASSTYSVGASFARGPFSMGTAYTDIRYPNGATPPFSVSVANVNTNGLHDLRTFGIGSSYQLGSGKIWGNWTRTRLTPLAARDATLDNYEVGGRYLVTPDVSTGLGYTFSDLHGQFRGRWHQVSSYLEYAFSQRTNIYLLVVFQKAAGSNEIGGRDVPVQAQIGASPAFIGPSGPEHDTQLVTRIGLRHTF